MPFRYTRDRCNHFHCDTVIPCRSQCCTQTSPHNRATNPRNHHIRRYCILGAGAGVLAAGVAATVTLVAAAVLAATAPVAMGTIREPGQIQVQAPCRNLQRTRHHRSETQILILIPIPCERCALSSTDSIASIAHTRGVSSVPSPSVAYVVLRREWERSIAR